MSIEITPHTLIEEIITNCPKSIDVFKRYNIHVFVCGEPVWDTLIVACQKSGIDVNIILSEIKKICHQQQ